MLRVASLKLEFPGNLVLDDINFDLAPSEIVGLIGPSGGGKSVLLKVIASVLSPTAGAVTLESGNSLSLMFQEGALFDSMTVFDNVAFPIVDGNVPVSNQEQEVQESALPIVSEILARVGLSKAAFKLPAQLSGGMRRRVSLARALVSRPKVLLLDDPTAGLDPVASSVIMSLISELHQEYKPTTLIVSHDLRRLLPSVQRIISLFDGTLCFDGSLSELAGFRHPLLHKFVTCRYDFQ